MDGIDIPVEINGECKFMKDLGENNHMGVYNLICTKRDLSLFIKGITPSKVFRLKHVKRYFGITGNAKVLHAKLRYIYETVFSPEQTNDAIFVGEESNEIEM
jgi:hypothetical protein